MDPHEGGGVQPGLEACEGVARQVGAGIEMGLTEGLAELGLDGARYELNTALLSVLDDDDHEARWWSGEPLDA